jgi:hypothetical protein
LVTVYEAIAAVLADLRREREERGGLACEPRQVRVREEMNAGQKTRENSQHQRPTMSTKVAATSITPRR